jgi:hypothetical protein
MEKKEVVDNEETIHLSFTLNNLFTFCYISIFWYEKYFEVNYILMRLKLTLKYLNFYLSILLRQHKICQIVIVFSISAQLSGFFCLLIRKFNKSTIKRLMCAHASTIYVIRYKANELWVIRCHPSATILWSLHVYRAIFNARI